MAQFSNPPPPIRPCSEIFLLPLQVATSPLVRDPPAVEPLEMTPLAGRSDHAEADRSEEPVKSDNDGVQNAKDSPLNLPVKPPRGPIRAETHYDDREPQRRVIMMDVGDTTHGDEGDVVQDPSNERVDARVVNLVHVGLLQVVVATLPAHGVEEHNEAEDTQTGSANPVDKWVAEKEVLHDCDMLEIAVS